MKTREVFQKKYWDLNYSDPKSMDGLANAVEHIRYLKAFFALEQIRVDYVVDLGFGYGGLLNQIIQQLQPKKIFGIEPSDHAFQKVHKSLKKNLKSKVILKQMDLLTWAQTKYSPDPVYGLAICTSVFQYLSEEEIDIILPVLSRRAHYVYFSVPTNIELNRQILELGYKDTYAIRRSRSWYLKKLKPYFTFVGNRVIESKHFYNEQNTPVGELLYRF